MNKNNAFIFAPQLNIPHNIHDISFYTKAFDAVELRRLPTAMAAFMWPNFLWVEHFFTCTKKVNAQVHSVPKNSMEQLQPSVFLFLMLIKYWERQKPQAQQLLNRPKITITATDKANSEIRLVICG